MSNKSSTTTILIVTVTLVAVAGIVLSAIAIHAINDLSHSVSDVAREVAGVSSSVRGLNNSIVSLNQSLFSLNKKLYGLEKSFYSNLTLIKEELSSAAFPIQIRDAMNRIVVIPSVPKKIVSIAPSVSEILFAIGAGNLVVGVDDYSNYPPLINQLVSEGKIVRVGGFSSIDIEKVLSLKPDLVVGTTGVQFRALYALSQTGLTTLSLSTSSIGDIYSSILLLGKITGHFKDALELVESLRNNMTSMYMRVSAIKIKPKILYLVWANPFYAAGGGSWFNDVINLAGGVNALANVTSQWPTISWEEILRLNPDIIIFSENAGGFNSALKALEWLASQPGGKELKAVQTHRVFMFHGELNDIASRPGPRVFLLQEALALIVHPEAFNITYDNLPLDLYQSNLTSIIS